MQQYAALRFALHLWPFPRGAGRITDCLFSRLKFKDEITTVRTSDGFEMQVRPNDLIGRHLYLTGEFDRTTPEVLINLARPSDVLIDIGANIGYVTACFLSNVPNSQAICIEPQPLALDLLKNNMMLFGNRATIHPFALSSDDGEQWMRIYETNSGASHLSDTGDTESVLVAKRSSTQFFANVQRADLIKIDVEGHEFEVLQGCAPHLERLQPRAIYFEQRGAEAAADGRIGSLLRRADYVIYGVRKLLASVDFVPITDASDCRYNDYVALPRSARLVHPTAKHLQAHNYGRVAQRM